MEFDLPAASHRSRRWACFGRGCLESLGVILGFVAFGAVWAALLAPDAPARATYTRLVSEPGAATPEPDAEGLWLIDGFNVVQVALLAGEPRERWWGAGVRERLIERARGFDDPGVELWVVFDGPGSAVRRFAGDGATLWSVFHPSADAWLLERVKRARDPSRVHLVTADRRLADRARQRGARVVAPREFLERCAHPPART